jgi:LPS-assembly protein
VVSEPSWIIDFIDATAQPLRRGPVSSPPRTSPRPIRPTPLVLALAAAWAGACVDAAAQVPQPAPALQPSPALEPHAGGDAARRLPIILRARELRGRPDLETVADGNAEFRRGDTSIAADLLSYDHPSDLARASGNVRVQRGGATYEGTELQLSVQRFEGFFANPRYHFDRTGAGGTAQRFDFLGEGRSVATGATYTSCPADGSGGPAWLLSTDEVKMDFGANEGIARNAVLRFYGVPILAAPVLSFPLTDERKSGWLPPSVNLDSKSGLQFSIPYYWNIAPNRDATISPIVAARRGVAAEGEFRYLEAFGGGHVGGVLWPDDRLALRQRWSLDLAHDGSPAEGLTVGWSMLRASDDDYWKDFPRQLDTKTPRLLPSRLRVERRLGGDWTAYARVQRWQVLQDTDPASTIVAPYAREPQLGVRTAQRVAGGLDVGFELEANRFTRPAHPAPGDESLPTGVRVHALANVARPFAWLGAQVTPQVSINTAHYTLDAPLDGETRRTRQRTVPTFSLDAQWALERDATWFGRSVRQTLEPRLLYVRTPYRRQDMRLAFDAAAKDFNVESIFGANAFSGVDLVSDANQLTAGLTTRLINPETGAETVRLSAVQRYLFSDQRITPERTGDPDQPFVPFRQNFSDLLLLGSSTLVPRWTLDAALQYNPDIRRTTRSVVSARYSPGPFRTLNLSYRFARSLSEQVEFGWQWPLAGLTPDERERLAPALQTTGSGSGCSGSWYTVGRVNYSTRDSRITDSILGFEYDAGCWIGRVVAERLSTGRSEATTRLLLQLELVGLSRLGSNPLQTLKDNIPGYRLLREDRGTPSSDTSP